MIIDTYLIFNSKPWVHRIFYFAGYFDYHALSLVNRCFNEVFKRNWNNELYMRMEGVDSITIHKREYNIRTEFFVGVKCYTGVFYHCDSCNTIEITPNRYRILRAYRYSNQCPITQKKDKSSIFVKYDMNVSYSQFSGLLVEIYEEKGYREVMYVLDRWRKKKKEDFYMRTLRGYDIVTRFSGIRKELWKIFCFFRIPRMVFEKIVLKKCCNRK